METNPRPRCGLSPTSPAAVPITRRMIGTMGGPVRGSKLVSELVRTVPCDALLSKRRSTTLFLQPLPRIATLLVKGDSGEPSTSAMTTLLHGSVGPENLAGVGGHHCLAPSSGRSLRLEDLQIRPADSSPGVCGYIRLGYPTPVAGRSTFSIDRNSPSQLNV